MKTDTVFECAGSGGEAVRVTAYYLGLSPVFTLSIQGESGSALVEIDPIQAHEMAHAIIEAFDAFVAECNQ